MLANIMLGNGCVALGGWLWLIEYNMDLELQFRFVCSFVADTEFESIFYAKAHIHWWRIGKGKRESEKETKQSQG